jgi:hypothetical protein
MYADDTTLYTSATTASEIIATFNKELQSVTIGPEQSSTAGH